MIKLTGTAAIDLAEALGLTLNKHADPTEGARDGLTVAEAREIAALDSNLVWVDVEDVAGAVDDQSIRALRRESIDAGDEAQRIICERALSSEEEWYAPRDARVSDAEAQRVERMTQDEARVECARVIAAAQAVRS